MVVGSLAANEGVTGSQMRSIMGLGMSPTATPDKLPRVVALQTTSILFLFFLFPLILPSSLHSIILFIGISTILKDFSEPL